MAYWKQEKGQKNSVDIPCQSCKNASTPENKTKADRVRMWHKPNTSPDDTDFIGVLQAVLSHFLDPIAFHEAKVKFCTKKVLESV